MLVTSSCPFEGLGRLRRKLHSAVSRAECDSSQGLTSSERSPAEPFLLQVQVHFLKRIKKTTTTFEIHVGRQARRRKNDNGEGHAGGDDNRSGGVGQDPDKIGFCSNREGLVWKAILLASCHLDELQLLVGRRPSLHMGDSPDTGGRRKIYLDSSL